MSKHISELETLKLVPFVGAASLVIGGGAYAAYRYLSYAETVQKFEPNVPGLFNLRNICYMNSVIQSLFSSNHFTRWLKSFSNVSDNSYIYHLKALLSDFESSYIGQHNKSHSAYPFYRQYTIEEGWTYSEDEQDCHEFLQHLYNCLERRSQELSERQMGLGELKDISKEETVIKELSMESSMRDSVQSDIFRTASRPFTVPPYIGRFWITRECRACQMKGGVKVENMNYLDLSFQSDSISRQSTPVLLMNLIRNFSLPTPLEGAQCRFCHASESECVIDENTSENYGAPFPTIHRQPALLQTYRLAMPPQMLCIRIQRTMWSQTYGAYKDERHVKFTKILDLQELLMSHSNIHEKDPTHSGCYYKLSAVVVHHGGCGSGHYVCYRQGDPSGATSNQLSDSGEINKSNWFYTSDRTTRKVSWSEVEKQTAYLLFYNKFNITNH